MTALRKVAEIKIGKRHRKDMGDIDALAASIEARGQLLQPVAIWPDGTLACGERRLLAVKKLGWDKVPVHVLTGADDLRARLKAERDENTCRKETSPNEALDLAEEIEAKDKADAAKRQKTGKSADGKAGGRGRKKEKPSEKFSEGFSNGEAGRARDKTAEAVGMKPHTYAKAKAVRDAAKENPDKFGDLPPKMDTDSVDAAFKEMKQRQAPPKAPPPPPAHPHSDRLINWLSYVSGQTYIIDIELGGIKALLAEPKKWDWREVRENILPRLALLGETITTFKQEIQHHADQQT